MLIRGARRFGAAVIMKIAYGHEIVSDGDEYIKLTENVSLAHVDAGDPGTAPVDFFPSREFRRICIVFLGVLI